MRVFKKGFEERNRVGICGFYGSIMSECKETGDLR